MIQCDKPPGTIVCPHCFGNRTLWQIGGSGSGQWVECQRCAGRGYVSPLRFSDQAMLQREEKKQ